MPTTVAPSQEKSTPSTLAKELDYSADQMIYWRDRVPIVTLIKALVKALRKGEKSIRFSA
jgi:hypothetical protein